jgi:hypothetical protein
LTTEDQGTTIATSLTGTSEKIIMTVTTEDIVSDIRDWSIETISLIKPINSANAKAIYDEFREWIEPESDEINILSLEPED